MKFTEELRARGVTRAVVGYAVAAFVVLQVAELTFEPLGFPYWLYRFTVVLAVVGLPVTAVVAWFFDLRSGRLERDLRGRDSDDRGLPAELSSDPPPRTSPLVAVGVAGATLAIAAVITFAIRPGADSTGGPVDGNLIAVAPFRVASSDPSLGYLREGMVDLLGAKLRDDPRAVDPRTLFTAWRDQAGSVESDLTREDAVSLAAGLGAGRVLLGSMVGSPAELTLSASLVEVPGGRVLAEATLQGPADSLAVLVDGLAGRLVGVQAGASMERLTSRSTEAVRHYLEGLTRYRAGDWGEATAAFLRAVEGDSTFAAAAAAALTANTMGLDQVDVARVRRLAWQYQDRLTEGDRALLRSNLGRNYPDATPVLEQIDFQAEVASRFPDLVEAWYELGDELLHHGNSTRIPDDLMRAAEAFQRTLELDSTFFNGRLHLAWTYQMLGDERWRTVSPVDSSDGLSFLLSGGALYLVPGGEAVDSLVEMDKAALERLESDALIGLVVNANTFLEPTDQAGRLTGVAGRALAVLSRRALPPRLASLASQLHYDLFMNLRRWDEARDVEVPGTGTSADGGELLEAVRLLERELLWGAPAGTNAEAARRRLQSWWSSTLNAAELLADEGSVRQACVLGLQAAAGGDAELARRISEAVQPAEELEAVKRSTVLSSRRTCALLLQAVVQDGPATGQVPPELSELRSWLDLGPAGRRMRLMANLLAARLLNDLELPNEALLNARRYDRGDPGLAGYLVRPLLEEELRAVESRGEDLGARTIRRRLAGFDWPPPDSDR